MIDRNLKAKRVFQTWTNLVELNQSMERAVLRLARHPDATDDQILHAVERYRDSFRRLKEAEHAVHVAVGHLARKPRQLSLTEVKWL